MQFNPKSPPGKCRLRTRAGFRSRSRSGSNSGNLPINEVCALKNRSHSGFYEDLKKGLVAIEKIGDRKSIVRGPVARRYIEGRPLAEDA